MKETGNSIFLKVDECLTHLLFHISPLNISIASLTNNTTRKIANPRAHSPSGINKHINITISDISIIKINPFFFHYIISFSISIIKSTPHQNTSITNGSANRIPIKISKYFICKHSFL